LAESVSLPTDSRSLVTEHVCAGHENLAVRVGFLDEVIHAGRHVSHVDQLARRVPRVDIAPAGSHAFLDERSGLRSTRLRRRNLPRGVAVGLSDVVSWPVHMVGSEAEVVIVGKAERRLGRTDDLAGGLTTLADFVQRVGEQAVVVEVRVLDVKFAEAGRATHQAPARGLDILPGLAVAGHISDFGLAVLTGRGQRDRCIQRAGADILNVGRKPQASQDRIRRVVHMGVVESDRLVRVAGRRRWDVHRERKAKRCRRHRRDAGRTEVVRRHGPQLRQFEAATSAGNREVTCGLRRVPGGATHETNLA